MRVIHIITSTDVGGAQIMLSRYLRALGSSRKSHSVIALMAQGPISKEFLSAGIPVHHFGLSPGAKSWRAMLDLRHKLATESPDVIFGWMYHGCLAALIGRVGLRSTALVWGIHHSLADIKAEKASTRMVIRMMAALSHRVDGISYCSSTSRTQHEAIGYARDRARVIPNAVNAAVFRPDHGARARLTELCGISKSSQIIGTVARNHPMKDHVAMVRTIAKLRANGRDVHGVLMGTGQANGPAQAEATVLGIADNISCLETRADVAALVPAFDAFLLSSAWGEAFPLAVAEAMAAGVPCIVTDVGDCAELVGPTGAVVPPRDLAAMARALSGILDLTPSERTASGLAGRARVAERFSFDPYIAAHETFYANALDNRRRACVPAMPTAAADPNGQKTERTERPEAGR
ncbi:glycosyltransferase [Sulfitobacter sp. AS92]|uniref:glycosyltransferase n=1 Tax=Sulfitobacter sp. AS92 TaxID=3135783 RepID=UPI00316E7F2D